jgi:predicted transcriptional regulator
MRPQRLDITLAFKAISLSDVLSGTEKQVAAAIIDSFNFRTTQCDPSFDRIAHLIGKNRRTIIRAVKRLVKFGFLSKAKHGGRYHRNAYLPNWVRFRSIEVSWKDRRRTRHWGSELSPSTVPVASHFGGDKPGTQTIPINHSNETSPPSSDTAVAERARAGEKPSAAAAVLPNASCPVRQSSPYPTSLATDAMTAARLSAERRWNHALVVRLRGNPELYGQVIDVLDPTLQEMATDAELARKGSGLTHLLDLLRARGLAA